MSGAAETCSPDADDFQHDACSICRDHQEEGRLLHSCYGLPSFLHLPRNIWKIFPEHSVQNFILVKSHLSILFRGHLKGYNKLVTVHGAHLLVRLRQTRSIGRPPDVENWTKTVLQASLTSVFVQFSPPREPMSFR